jgi:hypothetical protein
LNGDGLREKEPEVDWKERRGKFYAEGAQLDWHIMPKRNDKFFVQAFMAGGAKVPLPYKDFETVDDAMAWVEKREEDARKPASEPPIKL